jgi:hypothetical protein
MCIGTDPSCSFETIETSTFGIQSYTLTGLTKGTYYQFKVFAHNVVGEGPDSLPTTIVAANVPNKMDVPANVPSLTSRTQIGVTWSQPLQNVGSLITKYILHYKTQA